MSSINTENTTLYPYLYDIHYTLNIYKTWNKCLSNIGVLKTNLNNRTIFIDSPYSFKSTIIDNRTTILLSTTSSNKLQLHMLISFRFDNPSFVIQIAYQQNKKSSYRLLNIGKYINNNMMNVKYKSINDYTLEIYDIPYNYLLNQWEFNYKPYFHIHLINQTNNDIYGFTYDNLDDLLEQFKQLFI
jgi:hypothetical protein